MWGFETDSYRWEMYVFSQTSLSQTSLYLTAALTEASWLLLILSLYVTAVVGIASILKHFAGLIAEPHYCKSARYATLS